MTETEQNTELTEETTPQSEESTPQVVEDVEEVVAEEPQETPEEATAEGTPETPEEATAEGTPETPEEATAEGTPETPEGVTAEGTPEVPEEVAAEEISQDAEEGTEDKTAQEVPQTQEGMNWFVLRVASNKEDFVRNALEKKVQIEAVQHLVGRIMVPTEKTKTLTKTGKARISETKLYPGYIFVEMKLIDTRISQDVFFLIKETTGVGDFVGTAGKPTPMSKEEVDKMLYDSQAPEEVTEVKLEFAKGDHVNVKDGPFMGYEGTVDDIFPDKGVVRVLATVFGRQTQIDIEYWMIEKAD